MHLHRWMDASHSTCVTAGDGGSSAGFSLQRTLHHVFILSVPRQQQGLHVAEVPRIPPGWVWRFWSWVTGSIGLTWWESCDSAHTHIYIHWGVCVTSNCSHPFRVCWCWSRWGRVYINTSSSNNSSLCWLIIYVVDVESNHFSHQINMLTANIQDHLDGNRDLDAV